MKLVSKLGIFVILTALAVVAAGIYGALHNQVSFAIGPDYFQNLKFAQFGVPPDRHDAIGAAIVGWRASWWAGLALGVPSFLLGLAAIPEPYRYWRAGLHAIAAVLVFMALCGLIALLMGLLVGPDREVHILAYRLPIADTVGYTRAALLHNAAYICGALSLLVALRVVWRNRGGRLMRR